MKIWLPIILFFATVGEIVCAATQPTYIFSGGGYDGYDMLGVSNSVVCPIAYLYPGGGYDGYDMLGVTNNVANPIPGVIALSPGPLSFTAPYNGTAPYQVFSVSNSGALAYGYTNSVTYGAGASSWLSVNAPTGTLAGAVSQTHTATVAVAGLNVGTYYATNAVTLLSGSATNSPQTLIVMLTVTKGTPVITWSTPAPISYGTPLSGTQLNASSAADGTYAYTPASGTVLNPGPTMLQAVLSPTDSANYNTATSQVTITVNPTISVTAGIHGTIVPGGTVTVPYGGATNFIVSGVDSSYWIRSIVTNGVAVPAVAGLQIYTSQWQNVTSTGTITAAFDFIGRYSGGGYDGYDLASVTNRDVLAQQGSVYKIR